MPSLVANRQFVLFSVLAFAQALFICYLLNLLVVPARAVDVAVDMKLPPSSDSDQVSSERGFEPLLGENVHALWRGYARKGWPRNWKVKDGVLARTVNGGDIITNEQFDDFELRLEWKISPAGNSGILYRVSTGDPQPYYSGLECQVLDDSKHPDGKKEITSAGSLYGMYARSKSVTMPAGEWNKVRIVVRGNHVQHWLNDHKVVECTINSDDWNQRLAESKFAEWKKFAKNRKGHIALQDHQDPVWYRNIRIKRLETKK